MSPAALVIAPATFSRQPFQAIDSTCVLINILIRQPYWILRYYLRLALGAQSMRQLPRILTNCDLRFKVSSKVEFPSKPFPRCRAFWVPPASDAWINFWKVPTLMTTSSRFGDALPM
ncbi:BQ2448_6678 [Microbotryum intermedium]|uniref:BQ2448_6678 protein n=1 Tax=Microbotryum intermedium TaxID=269621 RepID=A0A238FT11_9BASI|nr:BQ2448_6678 [Microbotryum intermedium]